MFKNPPDDAAGRLIDQCGLKGARVGDAEISTVHANFFVNHGQAKAGDVKALIALAQQRVKETFGIESWSWRLNCWGCGARALKSGKD